MAKRRNLKKEKALRNLEYARKFRKRGGAGRFGKRRTFNSSGSGYGQNEDSDQENTNSEGATDA